ncbi:MAG: RNA-directed DNA polymerase [Oleiphilaceae bacterium]|jgi:RNA-directed DNA polymerase
MKKINISKFNEILNATGDALTLGQMVSAIPSTSVNEFQLKSKYCYDVTHKFKQCQRNISRRIINDLPLNIAAKGFRKGGSYLDFIEEHRVNFHFLRLDIKDFFHSISKDKVKESFSTYFESDKIVDSNEMTILDAFANVVTYDVPTQSSNKKFSGKNILPMGFVTSPGI